jgi:ABC-type antimicrobial peptide transport system permease subunit
LNWSDAPDSPPVVLLNRTAASYLWPNEDPIGQIALVNGKDARVVGVVSDVRESSLESRPGWQMYLSASQNSPDGAELVVRTKVPPDVLASSVMSTLRELNHGQPATEFRTIQQLVDHAVSPRRFFVWLVSLFAVLGVVLASLGIYGVISYTVSRQTQEIGIRMALGATANRVQFSVISRTLRLALAGIAIATGSFFHSGESHRVAFILPLTRQIRRPSQRRLNAESHRNSGGIYSRAPRLSRGPHDRSSRQLAGVRPLS